MYKRMDKTENSNRASGGRRKEELQGFLNNIADLRPKERALVDRPCVHMSGHILQNMPSRVIPRTGGLLNSIQRSGMPSRYKTRPPSN